MTNEDQPPADYSEARYNQQLTKRVKPRTYVVNASGHNGPPAKRKRAKKEPGAFVQGPVKMVPELVQEFARITRYLPSYVAHFARYAVGNVILSSPGASDYSPEKLWDSLGRWSSALRGVSEIEGVTNRHHGWMHVQKLRAAMARAENNPALQAKLKFPIHQYCREALLAFDKALAAHFEQFPDQLMSPEEFAGMAPIPLAEGLPKSKLFIKPKSISGQRPEAATAQVDPSYEVPPEDVAARKERGPQVAALFGTPKSPKEPSS